MFNLFKFLFNPEWLTFNFGGGGGGTPANTTSQVTTTSIPDYAKPYMEELLGKSQAFSETPYQAYGGQRVADFSPLQQQGFQNTANLGPANQIGMGTQVAGRAAMGSLNAGQNYQQQATNPYATQAYMSPYIQNALAPQMQEARRQSDITGMQNQGQAAMAGAFGGSRFGLQEAERQRNLGTMQNKIYGEGMQNAFDNAQKSQQFGATLGLQGFNQANAGANTFNQLGQTQFNQQQGAIQSQMNAGKQQQDQQQQILTQQYQDFLTQRGYPQQQLAFMSDILRGGPLSQSTQQQYTAAPSMASQMAQLGLGAYGVSQLTKKDGGIIKMAEGGIASGGKQNNSAGININKLQGMLSSMSPEQLQKTKENSQDVVTLSLVNQQEALNNRVMNSQALGKPLPTGTVKEELLARDRGIDVASRNDFGDTAVGEAEEAPQQTAQMARGGLAAFKNAGAVKAKPDDEADAIKAIKGMDFTKPVMTEQEIIDAEAAGIRRREAALGVDPNKALMEDYKKTLGSGTPENERKALLAFSAMKHFAAPGAFMSQLGNAGAGLGEDLAKFKKEDKESKRLQMQIQIEQNKAERAEKAGNYDAAQKHVEKVQALKETARDRELGKQTAIAGFGEKEKDRENRKEVAEIGARATMAAANRKDFNMQAFESTKKGMIADFTQKNRRAPTAAEMGMIERSAVAEVAPMLKPAYGGLEGKLGVSQAAQANDRIKAIDKELMNVQLGVVKYTPGQIAALQAEKAQMQAVIAKGTESGQGQPQQQQYQNGQTGTDKKGRPIVYQNGQWVYQ
jgi:hypothetical protein